MYFYFYKKSLGSDAVNRILVSSYNLPMKMDGFEFFVKLIFELQTKGLESGCISQESNNGDERQ